MKLSLFSLFIVCIFTISCHQSKSDNHPLDTTSSNINGEVGDGLVSIRIVDSLGNNIIGKVVSVVDFDSLKVYFMVNGQKQYFYHGNIIDPRGYRIISKKEDKYIMFYLNGAGDFPVTLIQYNDYDTDTIKTNSKNGNGSLFTKLWYNGKLKLPNDDFYNIITITKDW